MFELVYHSSSNSDISEKDIKDILDVSRRFNEDNEITGCLLFHNNSFVQILEGEENVVRQLYSRIEKDKRHFEVELLSSGIKGERFFDDWTMAYHRFTEEEFNSLSKEMFEQNLIAFTGFSDLNSRIVKIFCGKVREIIGKH
jgi:hypothetical protein